ncbi:MAG TPA: tyrosine-type recombinase/integrase [Candidatus Udaeobacter sp.]|nr:tyrosine-type recombinase/integrase [Candidatus Udaeobacter sp.]
MTTVKVGNTVVKIYHWRSKSGYDQFKVSYHEAGKLKRVTFGSLAKAKARANEIAVQIERGEREALKLTSSDRSTYLHALELLKPTRIPLHVAIEEYLSLRKPTLRPKKLLPDVVAELLEDKKANGASVRYMEDLRRRLNRFAQSFRTNVGSVTAGLIEKWILSLKVTPRTRNNYRAAIVTLFRYARKHGYLPREQQTEADLVDKVKDRGKKIEILTPKQMAKLMAKAKGKIALYLALAGFSGIRSAELLRLDWKDFNFARGHITVGAEKSKTATRRLVPILPNLAQYLQPYHRATGHLFKFKDDKRAIAWTRKNGVDPWPINCLRHSYASYRLAATADAARVALELGNSPAKLFSNYRELADEQEAKAWFAIPKRSKKIVQFAA